MTRFLLVFCILGAACLNAGSIITITINGTGSGPFTQWDTPVGGPAADVWRELSGPSYVDYASNPLIFNPGDSGLVTLRLEGFGGFSGLSHSTYDLEAFDGLNTLVLSCTVTGATCASVTSTGPIDGLSISNFSMAESSVDQVAAFATSPAPGGLPNSGTDIAVTFNYNVVSAAGDFAGVPEPSTIFFSMAGLGMLTLLRRRK